MKHNKLFPLFVVLFVGSMIGLASYASSVTTGQSNRGYIGSVTRQVINDASDSGRHGW